MTTPHKDALKKDMDGPGELWGVTFFFKGVCLIVVAAIVVVTTLTPYVLLIPEWLWLNTLKWKGI